MELVRSKEKGWAGIRRCFVIAAGVVLLLTMLVLAGCGGKDQPPGGEGEPASTTLPGEEGQTGPAETTAPQAEETAPEAGKIEDPLTGRQVHKVGSLVAVVIDNLQVARPQLGLSRAGVVYEIEAEGRITRLMALFAGDPPEDVGPVRSARTYFVVLAREWEAYLAHVGGSNDAYDKIARWKIRDLDDTRGHPGFWVNKAQQRPHSTYINLDKALAGKTVSGRYHWKFEKQLVEEPDYTEVSVAYRPNYRVTYRWDQGSRAYRRLVNGELQKDRLDDRSLVAANIIFQYARHKDLNDKDGHIDVELIGQGKAEFFLGGKYEQGSWEKAGLDTQTKFYDSGGRPVVLIPGPTWIQVVRPTVQVGKSR